jgi:hypothetical protein
MNENFFYIELKSPSEYDYINGRVKILETYLFTKDAIQHLTNLSSDEFMNELLSSHYKEYIAGNGIVDATKGISDFYNKMLLEMEKFVSKGFVNSFFRSKEIFLRLKKIAIEGKALDRRESEIENLIKDSSGDKRVRIFNDAYKKLVENKNDPLKTNLIINVYYIQFLLLSSLETKSDFIKGYYNVYASLNAELVLRRYVNLIKQNMIDNSFFNSALFIMKEVFQGSVFFAKILSVKNLEAFEEFLRSEEMYYGLNETFYTQPDVFVRKRLESYLDNGKFITVGVEPVFTYLSKLYFESELLKKILYAKDNMFESQEILKFLGFNYE